MEEYHMNMDTGITLPIMTPLSDGRWRLLVDRKVYFNNSCKAILPFCGSYFHHITDDKHRLPYFWP